MTDDLREALQNLSNIFCSLRLDRLYVASGKVTVAIDKADSVGRNRVLIENLRNELELRWVKELSRNYDSGQVFVLFKNGGFLVFDVVDPETQDFPDLELNPTPWCMCVDCLHGPCRRVKPGPYRVNGTSLCKQHALERTAP